jgi:hypothetical protein
MVMSITTQRVVAQVVPSALFMAPLIALIAMPDRAVGRVTELLQVYSKGSDLLWLAGAALLIIVIPITLGAVGSIVGWWLIRRAVSWEVAKTSLLNESGKPERLYSSIVKWYEANRDDGGT